MAGARRALPFVMIVHTAAVSGNSFADKASLQDAVGEWCDDESAARAKYGDINSWDVGMVSDMENLFEYNDNCMANIGQWNVSSVTSMKVRPLPNCRAA